MGGVDRFKELMTWLPTWSDARDVLKSLGISSSAVQDELVRTNALEHESELLVLYELIARRLSESETPRES